MQDSKLIGITFVSENFSNSIDSFWIIIKPEILINPFDFISVENVQNTKTIGMVKELKRIYIDRETISKNQYSSQFDLFLNTEEKVGDGIKQHHEECKGQAEPQNPALRRLSGNDVADFVGDGLVGVVSTHNALRTGLSWRLLH